jgi:hypothetical protein
MYFGVMFFVSRLYILGLQDSCLAHIIIITIHHFSIDSSKYFLQLHQYRTLFSRVGAYTEHVHPSSNVHALHRASPTLRAKAQG